MTEKLQLYFLYVFDNDREMKRLKMEKFSFVITVSDWWLHHIYAPAETLDTVAY